MTFQIVDGHDNEGTLANVAVEPATGPIKFEERTVSQAGTHVSRGWASQEWTYTLGWDEFDTQLTEYGLTILAPSNEVTVRTRGNDYDTFANYNATIVLESYERKGAFWKIRYALTMMEAL